MSKIIFVNNSEKTARLIHAFAINFRRENGRAPHQREIMNQFGLNCQLVVNALRLLEKTGRATYKSGHYSFTPIETPAIIVA